MVCACVVSSSYILVIWNASSTLFLIPFFEINVNNDILSDKRWNIKRLTMIGLRCSIMHYSKDLEIMRWEYWGLRLMNSTVVVEF